MTDRHKMIPSSQVSPQEAALYSSFSGCFTAGCSSLCLTQAGMHTVPTCINLSHLRLNSLIA